MKDLQVAKSNALVDASYYLPPQAQKLVLACLSKVDSRKEIPKSVTLTAMEFSQLMGIEQKHAYDELYSAADRLFKSSIIIRDESEEREIYWVQEKVKRLKGDGAVTLIWSETVLKYISQLKNRFTTYKLRHIANLQSAYSIRLYELLMRFNTTQERVIYLNDFRSMFMLEDKYSSFKFLNRDVIKPAVDELNQRSDLVIKYETIKQGRNVVALVFDFKQDDQMKMAI